jgi:hypothetical protein
MPRKPVDVRLISEHGALRIYRDGQSRLCLLAGFGPFSDHAAVPVAYPNYRRMLSDGVEMGAPDGSWEDGSLRARGQLQHAPRE